MKETNIFNSWLELDCFCMDIAEAWIKYCQSKNKEVKSEKFMEWVMTQLEPALETNFDDVYVEEFGHYEEEESDEYE